MGFTKLIGVRQNMISDEGGRGGVWTPSFLADIICVQPLMCGKALGKSQGQNQRATGPEGFGHGTSRGTPFTMIHPRLFHKFSLFCHHGPVKRYLLHFQLTQPVPMEHHKQYYMAEVKSLVKLFPYILARDVERMHTIGMSPL